MPRPEKPLDAAHPERHPLARYLRGLHTAAGLGYREIAEHPLAVRADGVRISAASFQGVAAARIFPTEDVTAAFAKICGGDVDKALKLRLKAARAAAWRRAWHAHNTALLEGRDPGERPPRRISPGDVSSLRDLRTAMRYIHLQAGAPSSRKLERAAPPGRLPHTTLDRLLDTREDPGLPTPELLDAFLAGCHVSGRNRKAWRDAYERLVHTDPAASARAWVRRVRDLPLSDYVMPDELASVVQQREDNYWFFRRLRRGHTWDIDPRSFGLPYDTVEEYIDQWAVAYADNKNMEESFD